MEFYSKNKFEKLVYLFGFILRIYHDARSPERQIINLYVHFNVTGWWCVAKKTIWLNPMDLNSVAVSRQRVDMLTMPFNVFCTVYLLHSLLQARGTLLHSHPHSISSKVFLFPALCCRASPLNSYLLGRVLPLTQRYVARGDI